MLVTKGKSARSSLGKFNFFEGLSIGRKCVGSNIAEAAGSLAWRDSYVQNVSQIQGDTCRTDDNDRGDGHIHALSGRQCGPSNNNGTEKYSQLEKSSLPGPFEQPV